MTYGKINLYILYISLVHLDWYYKISQTGWLIHNRNLFLIVIEVAKFKIKVWINLMSDWGPSSWFIKAIFLLCPHTVGAVRDLSEVSIIRSLLYRSPSWPKHLPKSLPPIIIMLEIWLQHMNLGSTQTVYNSECIFNFVRNCQTFQKCFIIFHQQ